MISRGMRWAAVLLLVLVGMGCQDAGKPKQRASSNQSAANGDAAPSGRKGKVLEADIYRLKGSILYYLHTYKGLVLFDLKDPKAPKKLAAAPVFGTPLEMFVRGGVAVIVLRNALIRQRNKRGGKLVYKPLLTSQVITVDVSRPTQPKILQRLNIDGDIREGVTRMVASTLYVVSYRKDAYGYRFWRTRRRITGRGFAQREVFVTSLDLSKPQRIRLIQKIPLIDGYKPKKHPERTHEFHTLLGVTLSATANTLLVAERRHYRWRKKQSWWYIERGYEPYTRMTIVDISDPKGRIKIHTRFRAEGHLDDQFKQSYQFDPKTKRALYLGIFRVRKWTNVAGGWGGWRRTIRNTLLSMDVSKGTAPKRLDALPFGKPNETVRGSLFDPDRKVVYAITAIQRDPLYVLSYKNPKKLAILSEIDGLSGDMNVFRFVQKRRFLLAVGRDQSSTCKGFGQNTVGSRVAVSLIDVRKLKQIKLARRACVRVKKTRWVGSIVNRNRDQAHKMIGMASANDGVTGLLTVPVFYYARDKSSLGWWYQSRNAVALFKWDLSQLPKGGQPELKQLATFPHPGGRIRRTIISELPAKEPKKLVLNLSNDVMSLVDIQKPSQPKMLSRTELSYTTKAAYDFGAYTAEVVTWSSDSYASSFLNNELRIRRKEPGKALGPILRRVSIGPLIRVFRWKHLLVFARYKQNERHILYKHKELLVFDLSNPAMPRLESVSLVPFAPTYGQLPSCDFNGKGGTIERFWQSAGYDRWATTTQGLAMIHRKYDRELAAYGMGSFWQTTIHFTDLQHPKKPKQQAIKVGRSKGDARLVVAGPGLVFVVLKKPVKSKNLFKVTLHEKGYLALPYLYEKGRWRRLRSIVSNQRLIAARVLPLSGAKPSVELVFLEASRSKGETTLWKRGQLGQQTSWKTVATYHWQKWGRLRGLQLAKDRVYVVTEHQQATSLHLLQWRGGTFHHKTFPKLINTPTSLLCGAKETLVLRALMRVLVVDVSSGTPKLLLQARHRRSPRLYTGSELHTSMGQSGALVSLGAFGTGVVTIQPPRTLQQDKQAPRPSAPPPTQAPASQPTSRAASLPTTRPSSSRP